MKIAVVVTGGLHPSGLDQVVPAWLALFDDPEQRAPTGPSLKSWLFGGASIPTKNALFPLDDYPGQIRADLFGDDSYFVEADLFWRCQNEAIAAAWLKP